LYCRKKKKKKSQCLGTHHKSAGPITHQWAAVQEAYISVPFFCLSSIGSSQPAAARESKGEIGSIHLLLPTGPALEATTPYHQENLGGLYFSYLLAPKLLSFSPLRTYTQCNHNHHNKPYDFNMRYIFLSFFFGEVCNCVRPARSIR
jgi:hypothetical protein